MKTKEKKENKNSLIYSGWVTNWQSCVPLITASGVGGTKSQLCKRSLKDFQRISFPFFFVVVFFLFVFLFFEGGAGGLREGGGGGAPLPTALFALEYDSVSLSYSSFFLSTPPPPPPPQFPFYFSFHFYFTTNNVVQGFNFSLLRAAPT